MDGIIVGKIVVGVKVGWFVWSIVDSMKDMIVGYWDGMHDGKMVSNWLGEREGSLFRESVGTSVGKDEGFKDWKAARNIVVELIGETVGRLEGYTVAAIIGSTVGNIVG